MPYCVPRQPKFFAPPPPVGIGTSSCERGDTANVLPKSRTWRAALPRPFLSGIFGLTPRPRVLEIPPRPWPLLALDIKRTRSAAMTGSTRSISRSACQRVMRPPPLQSAGLWCRSGPAPVFRALDQVPPLTPKFELLLPSDQTADILHDEAASRVCRRRPFGSRPNSHGRNDCGLGGRVRRSSQPGPLGPRGPARPRSRSGRPDPQ